MGKKKIISSAITEQISLPSIPGELKYKINLKCKNAKQKELVKKIKENQITIVEGVFGVGKTFVINSVALDMLKKQENDIDKIILICPTVETGDMHLGLLPGDLSQKVENHILNELDNWSYVRTDTGFMGYMHNWNLKGRETVIRESAFQAPVYESQSLGERVSLVWHQVTNQDGNARFDEMFEGVEGVNVVSPTWFALTDNEGNFRSLASGEYVEKAHARGMEVWALLDNFSDDVQTEVLLSSTSTRRRLIDNLMDEVRKFGIDGLNLDFESLKPEAGIHYIQFIRELSIECRANGIILSVDNYVPSAYTEFYNRKEQGIVADYVIVMAYDEHYAGGEMGTVSSLSYVQDGLANTMELVPKEKVIGAVPFFTRIWTVRDGKTTSRAVGMTAASRWVEENQVELQWLDDVGQYYGELKGEDGSVEYIWMEDLRSLELKAEAVADSRAAGIACWKLGFEPDEVWDVINP